MKKKNMAGKTGKLMISKMTVSNLGKQRARYILGGLEDDHTGGLSIADGPCANKPPKTKTFCGVLTCQ